MTSTYHLSSAQELSNEILEAIKLAFKDKSITITIEDSSNNYEFSRCWCFSEASPTAFI